RRLPTFLGTISYPELRYINGDLETYLAKGHPNIDVECGIKYYLNDKEIKNVMIPSSVTSLGCYAFQNSNFTSISLPSSLAFVGDGAFKNCSSLASITFSSGLVSIGSSAFSGCSGLTSLILPFGLNSIGSYAFAECRNLTRITLPASLSSIADYAFENCSNIASLTIPLGVAKIGDSAFSDCSRLTSLTIPSSVKSLGDYAFQKCSSLQSIYVSWSIPISVGKTFYAVDKSKCTLYVPQGTKHDYLLADVWGDFWNIIEYNPTGIDKVTTSTDAKELSRYSVNGQRLSAPAKGLNIVKYSDGSVKKVVVQ
ncbi:leucine-rich repeat domain-containing protein, partial [Segatella sp.]|uniref:leucine-rich repeat domain-containing protein n=1 Tax=Segatella sp. TaxID=2974253 RepID=UPI003080A300